MVWAVPSGQAMNLSPRPSKQERKSVDTGVQLRVFVPESVELGHMEPISEADLNVTATTSEPFESVCA